MIASGIRGLARPCLSTTRCLRQLPVRSAPRATIQDVLRQRRFQSSQGSTYGAAKKLFKAYPYSVSLATVFILCGAGGLMYANYFYNSYIIGAFHNFPEPVAKELRKALYFTNQDLKPHQAIKFYKKTLRVAEDIGMDPFSDEILGVKFQLAAFMEKIQKYHKAIQVLEIVRGDCLQWIEEFGDKPENAGKRTRVLGKTIGITVKLGELYAGEYVKEPELAEEKLVWAVEATLKELQRREKEGVKPDEGEWLNAEQIGGSFEALGNHYESRDQHYLSSPLFLQAINMSPPKSCHTAVLMNNLSISVAQQNAPTTPGQAPVSRPTLVANARAWAVKAIDIATNIAPPERTEECDLACAVATHNLAEFAEMDGDIAAARLKYEEAKSLSKVIGFKEGVSNAEKALRRLSEK
ncbi:hypothetical protein VE01_09254 [Pseudogymnoascus verrucosus]|uniref:TPR domain-containing protein n=1 Tax=Pseudogymnoascus verrucosus TaxID=342668 RepID=A0A1B8G9A0_9PEZI|nr:uncharacterized protein VE01_09254 [Pseudogymnoascus verrucosus]OBT92413.2 hypothetical protein VE01_09254 [Pseudogymnoascus verrucosus]